MTVLPDGTAPAPTVVVIGGDGVGPEVTAEAIGVLDAAGFDAGYVEADAGWDRWLATGEALSADTIGLVERHRLCLFGATTSHPDPVVADAVSRLGWRPFASPILTLRRRFDLDLSFRPAITFPGNRTNPLRRTSAGVEEVAVDLVVVRQNTEGLYAGIEWRPIPEHLAGAFGVDAADDAAATVRLVTRRAIERLMGAAFDLAVERGEGEVVIAEKPNVLRATSGLVVDVATRMGDERGIDAVPMNVDAVLMEMIGRPGRFGVIATTNLFGDLLSDAAAGMVGGPGFAPSSNIGREVAVFEPVHGSAPDIAGTGSANPIAAILAAAMLADHAGSGAVGARIRSAVRSAVAEGLPVGTAAVGAAVRRALG